MLRANLAPGIAQARKRLRRGDLMDKVEIDIEKRRVIAVSSWTTCSFPDFFE